MHEKRGTQALAMVVLAILVRLAAACATGVVPDGSSAIRVDQPAVVIGADDSGRDPAVVALTSDDGELCSAVLVAPDVVLTARHCVSLTSNSVTCPASSAQISGERPAASLRVLVGESLATAWEAARGRLVYAPSTDRLCGADIALVVLDQEIDSIAPLAISTTPVAAGEHVTALGFGRRIDGEPSGTKLLREHVQVRSVSGAEFEVGEATCQGDSGGPALDESTGQILGVVSRGGPACDADAANVYTRVDAFPELTAAALAASLSPSATRRDGGVSAKPATDVGKTCGKAGDCTTSVCVLPQQNPYCSRSCGTHDRCPTHFRCTATSDSSEVCLSN
ncbi:MAG TPA: trypsin-like serine protease [Polyangiaceae bacterium]|jgi:secreted trypsin-like serine protease